MLAVDNVGVDDYENNPELFPHVNQIFKHKMEMSNPILSKGNSSLSLAFIQDPGVIRGDEVGLCGDVESSANGIETKLPESPLKVALKGAEVNATPCSRLDLLLNRFQIVQEKIPVPGMPEFRGFVMTSSEYKPVSDNSPMFSIDCEWVLCRGGNVDSCCNGIK